MAGSSDGRSEWCRGRRRVRRKKGSREEERRERKWREEENELEEEERSEWSCQLTNGISAVNITIS